MHGVLVWWGNLWLESAISAEASGQLVTYDQRCLVDNWVNYEI